MHSNRILSEVVQGAVIEAGLPREAISYLTPDRRELDELLESGELDRDTPGPAPLAF